MIAKDIACVILILVILYMQIIEVINNIKIRQKYYNHLSKFYVLGFVILLSLISDAKIKYYITLVYGLILIILIACIYIFCSLIRKDKDINYIKKDFIILVFVFIIIIVIENL